MPDQEDALTTIRDVTGPRAVPLPDGRSLAVHEGGASAADAYGQDLLVRLPNAELWSRPRDGHVSVLEALPVAMDWLLEVASSGRA